MNIGLIGEKIAAVYLSLKGYEIVEKNFIVKGGEIDLIARKNKVLIFVEVKTRTTRLGGYPEEAATVKKFFHLRHAAECYLQNKKPTHIKEIRFDLISIMINKMIPPQIKHFKNINFDG